MSAEAKRQAAVDRNERWAKMSYDEQLADLDRRLGVGVGAVKQRAKIAAQKAAAEAKEKKGKRKKVTSVDDLLSLAEEAGWSTELNSNGHYKFTNPADPKKPVVFSGSTPSDHRALKNLQSQLRRAGLEV